jgi:predicted TIM-barrel fold metal-dependent hydrolase
MEIIANHAHVIPSNVLKGGSIEELIKLMGECEISKAVTFAPFSRDFENPNEWLKEQIKNDQRFIGFGTIDFAKDNIKEQVEKIRDFGFKGIKMHPAWQRFNVMCDKAQQVYTVAEELGLFVSFHTGIHWHRIKDYDIKLYDEVACTFPKLNFSMEHIGGYSYFYDAVGVLCNTGRVFAGFTSIFDWEKHKYWYLNEKQIHDVVHLIGAHRCIFGLDFPYGDVEETKKAINFIKNMNITDKEKELILGGTLKAVLNI